MFNINPTPIKPLVLFLLLLSAGIFHPMMATRAPAAGFSTNFNTYGISGDFYSNWNGACTFGAVCDSSYLGNGDPTSFYERAEQINGTWYFHAIVGDPATGFAQESYTRTGGNSSNNCLPGACDMQAATTPDGAGMARSVVAPGSSVPIISTNYGTLTSFMEAISNAGDPFDSTQISGNGGYDPSRSVFHMVLVSPSGDMAMDVNKPFLDKKPIISQTVQDGGMSSVFVTDMTKLGYSEMNKAAPVINNLVFDDPTIPGVGAANFDMANAQQSDITAGRYTFTKPVNYGWNTSTGGWDAPGSAFVLGIYTYSGAATGFDVYNTDWTSFFNYDQNALACLHPNNYQRIDEGKASFAGGPTGVGSCPGH